MKLLPTLFCTAYAFQFMSDEVINELLTPVNGYNHMFPEWLNREILYQALYEMETLSFYANRTDMASFKVPKGHMVFKEIQRAFTRTGAIDQRMPSQSITAFATKTLGVQNEIIHGKAIGIWNVANYARRPIPTRVGKLLRLQHQYWSEHPEVVEKLSTNSYLASYVNRKDEKASLFFQVLMIFGFLDVDREDECEAVGKVITQSEFFRKFLVTPHFCLTVLDDFMTLLVHAPGSELKRSDSHSTLPGFKLEDHKLSKSDEYAADFITKMGMLKINFRDEASVINISNFTVDMLFEKGSYKQC